MEMRLASLLCVNLKGAGDKLESSNPFLVQVPDSAILDCPASTADSVSGKDFLNPVDDKTVYYAVKSIEMLVCSGAYELPELMNFT